MRIPRVVHAARLVLLAALVNGAAIAQDAAAPQGAKVHMHGGEQGYAADGYVFQPERPGAFDPVLLIPDDRGVSDYVRGQAQALAAAGFVAVVVDLNRGQPPGTAPPAQADALHDLNAALNFLSSLPGRRSGAIGVAGWGTGADFALRLARASRDIRAVALTLPESPEESVFSGVHAALAGNFGGTKDRRLEALAAHLRARGHEVQFYFYPKAPGRFYDPEDAEHYRADDATLASQRLREFLARTLVVGERVR